MFDIADRSLSRVDERLTDLQILVAESKITAEQVRTRVQEWTKDGAAERLAEELELEARVQRLVAGLRRAELIAELSDDTIQQVGQMLELWAGFGLPLTSDLVDPISARLAEFNQELSNAIELAERFGNRISDNGNEATQAERVERIASATARLLSTFSKVDSHLNSLRDRFNDVRDGIGRLNTRTHNYIVAFAVAATLFCVWMGAGQVCLWRCSRQS